MSRSARVVKVALAAGLLCSLLFVAPAPAKPGRLSDAAVRRLQAPFLDSQAQEGALPSPMAPPAPAFTAPRARAAAAAAALAPKDGGQWDYLPPLPSDFNAIHAITGPNGKILLIAGSGNSPKDFVAKKFQSYLYDPSTGALTKIATPDDLFCSGHVLLPDGRALVIGGTAAIEPFKGLRAVYTFNFFTEKYENWTTAEAKARWYPTLVKMPDGRVIVQGGFSETGGTQTVSEVFDPQTNSLTPLPRPKSWPLYAQLTLAINQKLFFSGGASGNALIPPGFWEPYTGLKYNVTGLSAAGQRAAAATCLFGDVGNQDLLIAGGGFPATDHVDHIKLNAAAPAYTPAAPLPAASAYVQCVNLPDGTLLTFGGGSANQIAAARPETSILKSLTGPWKPMNPMPAGEHRLYHNGYCLLNDGTVLSFSSNPKGEPESKSLLRYSPPYKFTGPPPVITSAPSVMTYGQSHPVAATATGTTVTRFTLVTLTSTTHNLSSDQRYKNLPIKDGRITTPARTLMPPGYYHLFAVDGLGRPSAGQIVRLQ